MNSRTCGSMVSSEGEISCFFNNDGKFLLQNWLRAFARFPVPLDDVLGFQTELPYSRMDAPILYKAFH